MTERAKQPYEGIDAYEAGYKVGYEIGHDDATGISQWHWDCSGVGVWRCEACGYINDALPFDVTTNPYTWSSGKYCANCGRRMIDMEVEDE